MLPEIKIPDEAASILTTLIEKTRSAAISCQDGPYMSPDCMRHMETVWNSIDALPYRWCEVGRVDIEYFLVDSIAEPSSFLFVDSSIAPTVMKEDNRRLNAQGHTIRLDDRLLLSNDAAIPEESDIFRVPKGLFDIVFLYLMEYKNYGFLNPMGFLRSVDRLASELSDTLTSGSAPTEGETHSGATEPLPPTEEHLSQLRDGSSQQPNEDLTSVQPAGSNGIDVDDCPQSKIRLTDSGRTLVIGDKSYTFTSAQKGIIAVLGDNFERGNEYMEEMEILVRAGRDGSNLRDAFRSRLQDFEEITEQHPDNPDLWRLKA